MRTLAALLALACTGCSTQSGVTLPPLPKWVQPSGSGQIDAVVVANQTRARLPGVAVHYSDSRYTVVSKKWLDEFVTWTWHAAKAAGISYTPESFDCENFTGLFLGIAGLAASKAGVQAAPLVADVGVQLNATDRHSLVGVYTDEGAFIVEPNPDAGAFRVWKLDAYTKPILSVTWGSYNRPY